MISQRRGGGGAVEISQRRGGRDSRDITEEVIDIAVYTSTNANMFVWSEQLTCRSSVGVHATRPVGYLERGSIRGRMRSPHTHTHTHTHKYIYRPPTNRRLHTANLAT